MAALFISTIPWFTFVMPIYTIPDIHGQREMLEGALALIEADGATAQDEVIFLGDYVDRGPDSRGVLDVLITGLGQGLRWTCLLGNHDRMMLRYLTDGTVTDPQIKSGLQWTHRRFGGTAMATYGVDATAQISAAELHAQFARAVPRSHVDFLASLSSVEVRGDLLFAHAGIRPGVPLKDQHQDDLVWIRAEFLDHADPHPWLVVHGHTAIPAPRHFGNHIDLDGGAAMGRPLAVAVFEGHSCFLLTQSGRVPLLPEPLSPDEVAPWA